MVEGVEIVRRGKVRRAKLYYLRDRRGKSARIVEDTGVRARKLNDAERAAVQEEKARLEAEKVAAAQALAAEKGSRRSRSCQKPRLLKPRQPKKQLLQPPPPSRQQNKLQSIGIVGHF